MIIVWGAIEAKPEHLQAVIGLGRLHSQRSRREPGCIKHNVHIDAEQENRIVFYEEWQDMAALTTHFAVPASGEFVSAVRGLSVSAPDMQIYDATRHS